MNKEGLFSHLSPEELRQLVEQARGPEQIKEEAELKEIFGSSFLGTAEWEKALTLKDGTKLIEFTPQQKTEIQEALKRKLAEPDIQKFLRTHSVTPEQKQQLQKDFIFVLRCQKFSDGTPITMKTLNERLQPDFTAQNQGKILFKVGWYKDEDFYQKETTPNEFFWAIVKKEVIGTNQNFETQTQTLKEFAQKHHLDPNKTQRRLPVEILSDTLIYFRTTGERLLQATYDRTSRKFSGGILVGAGFFDADGFCVYRWFPKIATDNLGACPSR